MKFDIWNILDIIKHYVGHNQTDLWCFCIKCQTYDLFQRKPWAVRCHCNGNASLNHHIVLLWLYWPQDSGLWWMHSIHASSNPHIVLLWLCWPQDGRLWWVSCGGCASFNPDIVSLRFVGHKTMDCGGCLAVVALVLILTLYHFALLAIGWQAVVGVLQQPR